MRLALIPQGFTARGCYLHYVPTNWLPQKDSHLHLRSSELRVRPIQLNDTAVKNGAIARNCIGIFALRERGFAD
jgi:hypothetical protein